ncbi:MAG: hypothetical protein ACXV3D_10350 [Halobacteriota archaeon]
MDIKLTRALSANDVLLSSIVGEAAPATRNNRASRIACPGTGLSSMTAEQQPIYEQTTKSFKVIRCSLPLRYGT